MSALKPHADQTHDLGTTTARWKDVHADRLQISGVNNTNVTQNSSIGGRLTIDTLAINTQSSDLDLKNHKITSLGTPTENSDAATKSYVDGVAQGLSSITSVRVATTEAIELTFSGENSDSSTIYIASGDGSGLYGSLNGLTIDGVELSQNDRILIKNGADPNNQGSISNKWNGIYIHDGSDDGGITLKLTRAEDLNENSEFESFSKGAYIFIEEGTINADKGFVLTTDSDIIVGTTDLEFVQFSGAGQITAGAGLIKNGNELSVTGHLADIVGLSPSDDSFIVYDAFADSGSGAYIAASPAAALAAAGAVMTSDTDASGYSFVINEPTLVSNSSTKVPTQRSVKSYVDSVVQGISAKTSVVAATTEPGILLSKYEHGDEIDGVILSADDRILIKDQTDASENGIYVVKASGAPSRAADLAQGSNAAGVFVFVEEGTVNGDNGFLCTTNEASATVGTHSLTFVQFSSAGQITAGTGLSKSGNTLNVNISETNNNNTSNSYLIFADNYSGDHDLEADQSLYYNPSTYKLTTGIFEGVGPNFIAHGNTNIQLLGGLNSTKSSLSYYSGSISSDNLIFNVTSQAQLEIKASANGVDPSMNFYTQETAGLSNNNLLGEINFNGSESGLVYNKSASIQVKVDNPDELTPANAWTPGFSHPSKILFNTTAVDSSSPTTALTLDSNQDATFSGDVTLSDGTLYVKGSDTAKINIHHTSSSSATGPELELTAYKTSISSGDNLGEIWFKGSADNSNFYSAAAIIGEADGTWIPTSAYPGRLTFYTTSSGTPSYNEVLRLDSSKSANFYGDIVIHGTANYWSIEQTVAGTTNILSFNYNDSQKGYLSSVSNVANIDFTGQHRSVPKENASITGDDIGKIVVSSGTYRNLNAENVNKPNIDESLPTIMLSNARNDKKVYGIVSSLEDPNELTRQYNVGIFGSTMEKNGLDDNRVIVNSIGEGAIWVCNINGNLENGDYITTCEVPGLGMKQDDDLLHNYTVAKITQDCNFDLNATNYDVVEFVHEGQTYRKAFVGCTYHCG